jgi:hypothetical protein
VTEHEKEIRMKMKSLLSVAILMTAIGSALAVSPSAPDISGSYLEVRSCDVYTGPCFANAEMGVTGKEGILVWAISEGRWRGVALNGLNVIAVVQTDATLGDLRYQPRYGKAVLIVDARADAKQKEALTDLARTMAGKLIKDVVEVKTASMEVALGTCAKAGCASVKAGNLVEISTRCLGGKDHLCGNEEIYYPPLTKVDGAYPVFTEVAAYKGNGFNATWESVGQRSAFLASFAK